MRRTHSEGGFTLVELALTIAIIALLMTIVSSWFGNSIRAAKERGVPEKFLQDFGWARGAAGVADAGVLKSGLSGVPTVALTLNADCSWSSSVNGSTDATHSMTAAQLAAIGVSMACTGAALPATYSFDSQGGVGTTGSVTFTGSTNNWALQILASGSVVRTKVAS